MNMMKWMVGGAMSMALALGALTGCGKSDDAANAPGGQPVKTLVVGTEATFPPFEMRNDKNEYEGYDIDMVKAIGAKIGRPVEFKDMNFDALIPALQAGQIDLIASGLSITDERKNAVLFSDPYMNAGIALAVRGDETAIKGVDDLKGKVAAVQQGATGAEAATKLKESGVLRDIKYYPTVPLAMMELVKGGADVVISDRPTSEAYIAAAGGDRVKMLSTDLQADSYGLAFRKGNENLVKQVNQAMVDLKAAGEFDKLRDKYFKTPTTKP